MNGLGDWISYNANWAGDRVALRLGEESYTYLALDQAVDHRCHLHGHRSCGISIYM